jgi:hypothetical protein
MSIGRLLTIGHSLSPTDVARAPTIMTYTSLDRASGMLTGDLHVSMADTYLDRASGALTGSLHACCPRSRHYASSRSTSLVDKDPTGDGKVSLTHPFIDPLASLLLSGNTEPTIFDGLPFPINTPLQRITPIGGEPQWRATHLLPKWCLRAGTTAFIGVPPPLALLTENGAVIRSRRTPT